MFLTIFTPTYNRADTLRRTFESLCAQHDRDFEWIIVDDGSTDCTGEIVETFKEKADFPVRYYRRRHGGKHRAYNDALELAEGDWFYTVDSDDWLTGDSILTIRETCERIAKSGKNVCGIMALKENGDGVIYGNRFQGSDYVTTLSELYRSGSKGERSFIFKTSIARKYPFPTIEGEDFITECVVYDRIGADYPFWIVDKTLTVCEYQSGGLSSLDRIYKLMWHNPVGFLIFYHQRLNSDNRLKEVIHNALRYHAFRQISGRKDTPWSRYNGRNRAIVRLLSPVGLPGKIYYRLKASHVLTLM